MKYSEKISHAKAKLLVDYPFFGTLASKVQLVLNDDIQAFKNDGITLEYNSDFMNEITPKELEFVLANGAMHASMAYENRQGNRSNWLWELSSEYAINDILVQSGFKRPYQAHYSQRFNNLYTEEIYAQLKADIVRDAEELPENEGDDQKEQTQEQAQEQILNEELFKEFAQAILAKQEKDTPTYDLLKRFFNLDAESKYDWRDELRDAIDTYARDDYTQMPPNKKFLSQGIYLPSSTSETFNLVIAIDSSGSINDELLSEFLSEINSMMLSIQKYKIDILVSDFKIRSHKTFYSGEMLELVVEGGGATDFRPVFEYIEENIFDTKLLVYFSDLDGIYPKEMPSYEVKWISPYSKTI